MRRFRSADRARGIAVGGALRPDSSGTAFLTDITVRPRASPATQRQALNAIVFLVQEALGRLMIRGGKGDKDRVTVSPTRLRKPLAHLLEAGADIRTVQELLGHESVETTQTYTRVMQKPGLPPLPEPIRLGGRVGCPLTLAA